MKILVITHIYPNNLEPMGGIFNRYQIEFLSKHCEIKVIAPLPWYPGASFFPKRAEFPNAGKVLKEEIINGIEVKHPLYFVIPIIGRFLHGIAYFLRVLPVVLAVKRQFSFNVIYSTYAYPDSFAAALIALILRKPLIAKVHGSDINVIAKSFLRGKFVRFALSRAEKIIAVSEALKKEMIKMGVEEAKIIVVYNGVDKTIFQKRSIVASRKDLMLKMEGKVIVFIGNLKKIKGLTFLIEAVEMLKKNKFPAKLFIIGKGPIKDQLRRLVNCKSLEVDVTFLGGMFQKEILLWINAADIVCLPSINEGVPNVILESLSCGKAVVATNVGGIPEIVNSSDYGILLEPKNSKALAMALENALKKNWNRDKIVEYAECFSWKKNATILYDIMVQIHKDFK